MTVTFRTVSKSFFFLLLLLLSLTINLPGFQRRWFLCGGLVGLGLGHRARSRLGGHLRLRFGLARRRGLLLLLGSIDSRLCFLLVVLRD